MASSLGHQGFSISEPTLLSNTPHSPAEQHSYHCLNMAGASIPLCLSTCLSYSPNYSLGFCFLTQPLKGLFQFQLFNEANILFESLAEMTASSPAGPWHLRVYLPTSSWELGGHCSGFEVRWIRVGVLTQTFSSCVNVGKSLSPSFNNNPFPKNYWDNPVT